MKIKLLRKLRKLYKLQQRNGKFKVFEDRECIGGIFNQTDWINREEALNIRRIKILQESEKYKIAKKTK